MQIAVVLSLILLALLALAAALFAWRNGVRDDGGSSLPSQRSSRCEARKVRETSWGGISEATLRRRISPKIAMEHALTRGSGPQPSPVGFLHRGAVNDA